MNDLGRAFADQICGLIVLVAVGALIVGALVTAGVIYAVPWLIEHVHVTIPR